MKPKMMSAPFTSRSVLLASALMLAHAAPTAMAATGTWTNITANGGVGTWSTAANWTGSIPTAAGDVANFNFNFTTNNKTVTLDSPRTVGAMTFGDPTSAYWTVTINNTDNAGLTFDNNGSPATINKNSTSNPVLDVIGVPVTLTSNLTISSASPGDSTQGSTSLHFTGAISGPGAITKNGTGAIWFNVVNTYAGGTTINAGKLHIGSSNALGSGPVALNGGEIVPRGANRNIPNAVTLGADLTVGVAGINNQMAFGGAMNLGNATRTITVTDTTVATDVIISGGASNGGIIKAGAGTLQIGGTNTYTGPTTLNAGALFLTGSLSDSTVSVASNTTFTQSVAGAINGTASFTSSGTSTLNGTNTYTGATTISGGSLALTAIHPIDNSSAVSINGANARLTVGGTAPGTIMVPPVTLTQGTVDGPGTINSLVVADALSNVVAPGNGTGYALQVDSLTFQGAATLNVRATGNFSDQYILAGNLTTSAAADVVVNAVNTGGAWITGVDYTVIDFDTYSSALDASHFTLAPVPGLNPTQTATLVNTGTELVMRITGDTLKWTGQENSNWTTVPISGSKNWTFQGVGSEYANGNAVSFDDLATRYDVEITQNVSPGITIVENATFDYTISSSGGFGIQAGSFTKSGAAKLTLSTNNSYTGATTINAGIFEIGGSGSIAASSSIKNDAQLVFNPTGATAPYANPITGLGSLKKTGAGSLTLSGANTFTGGLTLEAGTLNLNSAGSLGGGTTGIVTITGGTLDNSSAADVVLTSTKAQNWNGNFSFTGTKSLDMGSGNVTVAGDGTERVVTVSGGTLTVGEIKSAAHGLTKEGAGTLVVTSVGSGAGSSVVTGTLAVNGGTLQINRSGTNDLNSGDFTVSGLMGSGKITNGASFERWMVVNTTATNNAFSGSFENGGTSPFGLIKQGTGSLTLTGTSTHTGPTRIDAGILTLASNGAAGASTVTNRNRAGAIHLEGNITLTNNFVLSNDGSTSGAIGYSLMNVSGNNTIEGTVSITDGGGHAVIRSAAGKLTIAGGVTDITTVSRILMLGGASTEDNTVSGVISNGATAPLVMSVEKQDAGKWILSGANTYTGTTTVKQGTLSITQPTLNDSATVTIETTGAVLNLAHSSTDQVGSLVINGVTKANGVYDATTDPGFITGTGKIRVGPPAAGYASWTASFAGFTAGVNDGPEQDADGDGINNVLEYVLGGIPVGPGSHDMSILPAQSLTTDDLVLTFHRSDISESDAVVKVQWSSNLATWNDFATLTTGDELPKVDITEDSPTPAMDTVVVRIPRTNAVNGKIFGRVVATKP